MPVWWDKELVFQSFSIARVPYCQYLAILVLPVYLVVCSSRLFWTSWSGYCEVVHIYTLPFTDSYHTNNVLFTITLSTWEIFAQPWMNSNIWHTFPCNLDANFFQCLVYNLLKGLRLLSEQLESNPVWADTPSIEL